MDPVVRVRIQKLDVTYIQFQCDKLCSIAKQFLQFFKIYNLDTFKLPFHNTVFSFTYVSFPLHQNQQF
jgi:hypothetical protein